MWPQPYPGLLTQSDSRSSGSSGMGRVIGELACRSMTRSGSMVPGCSHDCPSPSPTTVRSASCARVEASTTVSTTSRTQRAVKSRRRSAGTVSPHVSSIGAVGRPPSSRSRMSKPSSAGSSALQRPSSTRTSMSPLRSNGRIVNVPSTPTCSTSPSSTVHEPSTVTRSTPASSAGSSGPGCGIEPRASRDSEPAPGTGTESEGVTRSEPFAAAPVATARGSSSAKAGSPRPRIDHATAIASAARTRVSHRRMPPLARRLAGLPSARNFAVPSA